ncbi:MAG TPA: GNAT family N-acetyltransferase [Usitatibacter sp.]|jgi:predicted GNAT family N-acyltransferase|nr:GNAT family N-acetyltransferase [Usitatibacter sp.]
MAAIPFIRRRRWDTIRVVTDAEGLEKIFAFRYRIYVEEMHRFQKDADHARRRIRDSLDDGAINIAAFDGDEVVGVVRANESRQSSLGAYESFFQLDRMGKDHPPHTSIVTRLMIAPHLRRSTLAVRLCIECYTLGLEEGIKWCFIDCNDHLVDFFRGLGFMPYIGKVDHEEYGEVTPMRLRLNDLEHLEAVRSPFAACLRNWLDNPLAQPDPTVAGGLGD